MKVDLSDQVAVVTGGAAGIGRAIVSTLSDNGARVVIIDVDVERARSTASEISAKGRSCVEMSVVSIAIRDACRKCSSRQREHATHLYKLRRKGAYILTGFNGAAGRGCVRCRMAHQTRNPSSRIAATSTT